MYFEKSQKNQSFEKEIIAVDPHDMSKNVKFMEDLTDFVSRTTWKFSENRFVVDEYTLPFKKGNDSVYIKSYVITLEKMQAFTRIKILSNSFFRVTRGNMIDASVIVAKPSFLQNALKHIM